MCDSSAESVIVNLPDPATVKGLKFIFKKIASSHNVEINGTIDTLPMYSFNSVFESVTIMSDGTQYYAVGRYHG